MEEILPAITLMFYLALPAAASVLFIDLLFGRAGGNRIMRLSLSVCAFVLVYAVILWKYFAAIQMLGFVHNAPVYGFGIGLIVARVIQLYFTPSTISTRYALLRQVVGIIVPFTALFFGGILFYILTEGGLAMLAILWVPILFAVLGIPAAVLALAYAVLANLASLLPKRGIVTLVLLCAAVSILLYNLLYIAELGLSKIIF